MKFKTKFNLTSDRNIILATAFALLGLASNANATLVGDTVTVDYISGSGDHNYNVIVGADTDPLSLFSNNHLLVKITDGLIQFTDNYFSNHAAIYGFDPILLTLTVSGMDFSDGAHVIGADSLGGTLQPQNITFSSNSVSFQFLDSLCISTHTNCMTGGDFAAVSFRTDSVPSVPEPENYAMLMAGLGVMGLAARRRKNKLA